jgi:uncharacterized membrane protein
VEFAFAKLLHFTGLSVWLAIIPVEVLLAHRLLQTSDPRERIELLRFEDMFSYRTELPALTLAVVGGLWLSWLYGFSELLAQSWYTSKLAIIGYLVVTESLVVTGRARIASALETALAHGREPGPEVYRWYSLMVVLGAGALLGVVLVLFLVVMRRFPFDGVVAALVLAGIAGVLLLPSVNRALWKSEPAPRRAEVMER